MLRISNRFEWQTAMLTLLWMILTFPATFVDTHFYQDAVLCRPQHVHIAYGDSLSEMVVVWATKGNCSTLVHYGTAQWQLDQQTVGRSVQFWEQNFHGLHYYHRVKLTDLATSTTYFYRPTSNNIGKGPFYFKTPGTDLDWSPDFLVFGDLGVHSETIPLLVEEALTGEYTALLHIGDFAYNLKDSDGIVGDQFMKMIEPVAAFLPYMTAPGNHEIDSDTFAHYCHRFSMPRSPWPMTTSSLWYSFDIGPVHFISYSTEVFFVLNGTTEKQQFDWLVGDLKRANAQRERRPWIVAFGHRPLYCSVNSRDDCTKNNSLVRAGLEDVFYHYGVDLILQAHEHNYERLYPMYKGVVVSHNYTDPPAPVQIISGAAGSKHGVDPFMPLPKPEWSAVRAGAEALDSYGRLRVVNGTHLLWEQRSVHNHSLLDTLWLQQRHHGKFRLGSLSANLSQEIGENIVTQGGVKPGLEDGDEESDLNNAEELKEGDKLRRIVIGAIFGGLFAVLIVLALATRACRRKRYTAVRRWDAMDLDYGKKLFTPGKDDDDDDIDKDFEIDMVDTNLQSTKLLNNK